jgi:GntR family phosphonate transport system transcriptional regulator
MLPKSMTWIEIRDALSRMIAAGELAPGERLPSEPELTLQFRAGRHSVRRALSVLSAEGRVRIEHGRGVFVREQPAFQYTIDRNSRLFDQLVRDGHNGKAVTRTTGEEPAAPEIAKALGLSSGTLVHVSEVLLKADDTVLGIGRSYHPLLRFPDYQAHRRFAPTQRNFYRSYGISEYFRQQTFLWARPATPQESALLEQHHAMPVVETHAQDIDASGAAIGLSTTIWASSRIRFVLPTR